MSDDAEHEAQARSDERFGQQSAQVWVDDDDDASVGRVAIRLIRKAPIAEVEATSDDDGEALDSLEALPEFSAITSADGVDANPPVVEAVLDESIEALWGEDGLDDNDEPPPEALVVEALPFEPEPEPPGVEDEIPLEWIGQKRPPSTLPFNFEDSLPHGDLEGQANPEDLLDELLSLSASPLEADEEEGSRLPFLTGEARPKAPLREDTGALPLVADEDSWDAVSDLLDLPSERVEEISAAVLEPVSKERSGGEGGAEAAPDLLIEIGVQPSSEAIAEFKDMSLDELVKEVEGIIEHPDGDEPSSEHAPAEGGAAEGAPEELSPPSTEGGAEGGPPDEIAPMVEATVLVAEPAPPSKASPEAPTAPAAEVETKAEAPKKKGRKKKGRKAASKRRKAAPKGEEATPGAEPGAKEAASAAEFGAAAEPKRAETAPNAKGKKAKRKARAKKPHPLTQVEEGSPSKRGGPAEALAAQVAPEPTAPTEEGPRPSPTPEPTPPAAAEPPSEAESPVIVGIPVPPPPPPPKERAARPRRVRGLPKVKEPVKGPGGLDIPLTGALAAALAEAEVVKQRAARATVASDPMAEALAEIEGEARVVPAEGGAPVISVDVSAATAGPLAQALNAIAAQRGERDDPLEEALAELEGESEAWVSEEEPTVLTAEIALAALPERVVTRARDGFTLVSGGPDQRQRGDDTPHKPELEPLPWETGTAQRRPPSLPPSAEAERPWWMPPEDDDDQAPSDDPWSAIWEKQVGGGRSAAPREPATRPTVHPPVVEPSGSNAQVWKPLSEGPTAYGRVDPVAEALKILQASKQPARSPRSGGGAPRPSGKSSRRSSRSAAAEGGSFPGKGAVPGQSWQPPVEPRREAPATPPRRSRNDRRRHERVHQKTAKVYFRRRGRIATGDLKDLSFTGCSILTRTPLPPGSEIPLGLELEGMRTIRSLARVVWVRQEDPYGDEPTACMGVAFTGMEEESRRLLAMYLSRAVL